MEPRQERSELGRDARSGLVLKDAFAEHPFEKQGISDKPALHVLGGCQRMLASALQDELPILNETEIENICGRDHRSLHIAPTETNGTKFDFELAYVGHRCVGCIERPVGKRNS